MKTIIQNVEITIISSDVGIGMDGIVKLKTVISSDGSRDQIQTEVNKHVNGVCPVGTVLTSRWKVLSTWTPSGTRIFPSPIAK